MCMRERSLLLEVSEFGLDPFATFPGTVAMDLSEIPISHYSACMEA